MLTGSAIIQNLAIDLPYTLDVLRLDLLDPEISGNKWFKLNRNLLKASELGYRTLLTFGGAHSNHLAATAAACQRAGIKAIAVVRGETEEAISPTLVRASRQGMQLHFVSRDAYRQKNETSFLEDLKNKFGNFYYVPEGGNNEEGFLGCREILQEEMDHDYVFCACGTGTTYAGLVASARPGQAVIGVSVLKGRNTLVNDVNALLGKIPGAPFPLVGGNEVLGREKIQQHVLTNAYCFKGYASLEQEWLNVKQEFERRHRIALDYIYTGKLIYALFELMRSDKLNKGAKILMIHSGGLQGNKAFEARYHLTPTL